MKRKAKQYSLTIYLSKPDIDIQDCFDKDKIHKYKANPIPMQKDLNAKTYVYQSIPTPPSWVKYIKTATSTAGATQIDAFIKSTSTFSGIIALPIASSKRFAILTFGYGKSLISYKKVEQFFGRNVVLNAAGHSKIKSIKSQSYDSQPRHRQDQASISTALHEFSLDLESEILQKLTAEMNSDILDNEKISSEHLGLTLTGYDSLTLNCSLEIPKLFPLLKLLVKLFSSTSYKKALPEIDTFAPEKDEDKITQLNEILISKIRALDLEGIHITVPYILDYSEYSIFSIKGFGKIEDGTFNPTFPTVDEFVSVLSEKNLLEKLNIETLEEKYKLVCKSSISDDRNKYPNLYRCLSTEVEYDNDLYSIMDGKWFKIEKSFYKKMIKYTNSHVKLDAVNLDNFDKEVFKQEEDYNIAQAEKHGHLCYDRKTITLNGQGSIEVCDLLTQNNGLIHVKRYTGSSDLSHLFAQGFVSIKSLSGDDAFMNDFLKQLPRNRKAGFKKAIKNRKSSVVYVVLFEQMPTKVADKKIENLPIFSIVNLYKHCKAIKNLGYDVKIQMIF